MCHVMLDLETLGKNAGCAIASIGACTFDLSGVKDRFYFKIDIETTPLRIDPGTVAWWMKQEDAAIKATFSDPNGPHIKGLNAFSDWWLAHKGEFLWAHGASFDPPILQYAYDFDHLLAPWSYRNVRDTRTIFALAGEGIGASSGIYHSSMDDAVTQAESLIRAFKKLGLQIDVPASVG